MAVLEKYKFGGDALLFLYTLVMWIKLNLITRRLVLRPPNHTPIHPLRHLSTTIRNYFSDEEFIRRHTVISKDHLTPELSLHLITPKCELWRGKPPDSLFESDPFWAIYWPGGQALSRYILDNQGLFIGKNVIDIGSGSGACAIAAAKCDAATVMANDIDRLSLKAIQMNADLNQVRVYLNENNIVGQNIDTVEVMKDKAIVKVVWDIVLIGDMFYDSDFSNCLFQWLCELNEMGKTVYVGDPGRYAVNDIVKSGKLFKVVDYPTMENEHYGFSSLSVWKVNC